MKGRVRLTITFSDPATQWLEEETSDRAISLTELIRRIVDETRGTYIIEPKLNRCRHHDGQPPINRNAPDGRTERGSLVIVLRVAPAEP